MRFLLLIDFSYGLILIYQYRRNYHTKRHPIRLIYQEPFNNLLLQRIFVWM
jgi:hypothetical protein